jgi:hypothetical protein
MKAEVFESQLGFSVKIMHNHKSVGQIFLLDDEEDAEQHAKRFNSALSQHVQSELEKYGIVTNPSKEFLETISGKGTKINPEELARMRANYESIMAISEPKSALYAKIELIEKDLTDKKIRELNPIWVRDEIIKRLKNG